jgi:hypothetical protein
MSASNQALHEAVEIRVSLDERPVPLVRRHADHPDRSAQRYGCTRHWRRGTSACANGLLVRRDRGEAGVIDLLHAELYTSNAVARMVEAVNARLQTRRPTMTAERDRLRAQLQEVDQRLSGLRQFVERGDTSPKVRQWLGEAEQDEERLRQQTLQIEAQADRAPLQVQPATVEAALRDLKPRLPREATDRASCCRRALSGLSFTRSAQKTGKPFARAEVITTSKGLLDRVAFMVAGRAVDDAIALLRSPSDSR